MRRLGVWTVVLVLAGQACVFSDGTNSRTVFVDWSHDEFAAGAILNYPTKVTVAQGDEIVFKQTWTGEPHTVTGGTLVDDLFDLMVPFFEAKARGEELPDEPPPELEALMTEIGSVWDDENDGLNQTLAQPCYVAADGEHEPQDGEPCEEQEQPAFDGTQRVYNSGVIPFEGVAGNTFTVRLAEDIEPGTYSFFCAVHGPFQRTTVDVKPEGTDIPSQATVAKAGNDEIGEVSKKLEALYEQALAGSIEIGGRTVDGPFAGLWSPEVEDAFIVEFIPRRIQAKAGEPINWKVIGYHSISFGVPPYFPVVEWLEDGEVRLNPEMDEVVGAEPWDRRDDDARYEGDEPKVYDAGTYDGDGFWSTGLFDADPYVDFTMRVSKPGTYRYACLIHPAMVGTLEVT